MKAILTLFIIAQDLTQVWFFRPFPHVLLVSKERVSAVAKGTDTNKRAMPGCCHQPSEGKRWHVQSEQAMDFCTPGSSSGQLLASGHHRRSKIHVDSKGIGGGEKNIAVGLPNAPTPHLGWEDPKPQMAGGQESTLQRQHNMLTLFGGTPLGVCPWLLVEVDKMALQPDPKLPSCGLVSQIELRSSAH